MNQDNQVPGEASITPQQVSQVAPDTQGQQGQAEMLQKLVGAHTMKNMLDNAFKLAAKATGADFSSRVKDPDTIEKKIVQKRLEHREYDIDDIRDSYGGRFTVMDKKDIPKVKEQIGAMADAKLFKILKEEKRQDGTYSAYHYDIKTIDGHSGEVQIHTAQSALESVANHDIRAVHGENPQNEAVNRLKEKQASLAHSMPPQKALAVTQMLQGVHKQNGNKPVNPQITAAILAQANQ